MVGLVDENQVRNTVSVQKLKDRGHCHHPGRIRVYDHDGDITDHCGFTGILGEIDRTRTINEVPFFTKIGGVCAGKFGAHAAGAGFASGVTNGVVIAHRPLAMQGAGRKKQAFKQGCLAAGIGANQGGNPRGMWLGR